MMPTTGDFYGAAPAALAEALQLDRLRAKPPVAVLDELHKYTKWKALLKANESCEFVATAPSNNVAKSVPCLTLCNEGQDGFLSDHLVNVPLVNAMER